MGVYCNQGMVLFGGIGREILSQCGGQPWQISGYGHSAVVDESLRMWIYGYGGAWAGVMAWILGHGFIELNCLCRRLEL
jgi:hypothetical protein